LYRFEKHGTIRIGFVGDDDFTGEDYPALIDKISSLDDTYRNRLEINIIGKFSCDDSMVIFEKIKEKKLSGKVLYVNQRRSFEEFYRMVGELHFLMPVVRASKYGSILSDLSGLSRTISIALIARKPLVLSDNFKLEMSLQSIAVFYPDESMEKGIMAAIDMRPDKYYKICSNFSNLDEASEEMQLMMFRKMLRSVLA
jgi:hypothetical protein